MKVEKNKVVSLAYSIFNKDGRLLEVRSPEDPVEFLVGHGQILQVLEDKILGETEGFMGQFIFAPEEAHGEYRTELVIQMDREQFPKDISIEKGMKFESRGPKGEQLALHVLDIQGDHVLVDGNHPLAGETLQFEVKILDVREAAKEEIIRGRVLTNMAPTNVTRH